MSNTPITPYKSRRKQSRTKSSNEESGSEIGVRLNKLIAQAGIASRRHADELITEGAVQINGKTVFELGRRVQPGIDHVSVNGKPVRVESRSVYLMFHKPKQVLTTMEDPEGRPCLGDYVRRLPVRVFPVGRLDWDSEGLIILTNDGDFAQKVSHPRFKVPKTYIVKVERDLTPAQVQKLLRGISIPGGRAKAVKLERIAKKGEGSHPWYQVIIEEGINRQIRHMFAKFQIDVLKLQRVAIGHLRLAHLPRGAMVDLDADDLARIFRPLTPKPEGKYVSGKGQGRTPQRRQNSTKRLTQNM